MTDAIEAALCLWEAMLEARPKEWADSGDDESWRFRLDSLWHEVGTAAMRLSCIEAGKQIDAIWRDLSQDERDDFAPFDWDFVPTYLEHVLCAEGDLSHEQALATMRAQLR
jgi:hypothetical protein